MRRQWRVKNKAILLVGIAFAVAAALWIVIQPGPDDNPVKPMAEHGELDLSNWRFGSDGAVRLDGQWALYWEELLTPHDFEKLDVSRREPMYANVPNIWSSYNRDGKPLSGEGYATYRLRVRLNPSAIPKELALKLPTMSTACRLWVNGEELAQCGTVSRDKESASPRFAPQSLSFPVQSNRLDIIVQISNYSYNSGGMWYAMNLGLPEQISAYRDIGLSLDMTLFGIFLFMGLYHIFIFSQRRDMKTALLFGVGCLIGSMRLLVSGEIFVLELFPQLEISILTMVSYFTYYGGIMFFILYLRQLYPEEMPKRFTGIVVSICILFILSVWLSPMSFYTDSILYYHLIMLIVNVKLIHVIWLSVKRKRPGARLQFFGIIFFILTFIIDIAINAFYAGAIFRNTLLFYMLDRQMILMGLFVLVFVQAIVLANRYSSAFHTIEAMSETLIRQNKMKDEFLVNTSHELITPLHGIMNLSQAMLEGAKGPMNKEQQHNLTTVVSVTRRLTKLIYDIMDYSKLRNDDIKLNKRNVSLHAIMRANGDVFLHLIDDKPVELHIDVPESLPHVYADEDRLQQILYNLIGNAAKFTHEGRIAVAACERNGMLEVTVSDTGIGISEEKHEQIFQSFEQVGKAVANEYGGTGLGLSITKGLVELSGGEIHVRSIPGQGSTFTFTLPIAVQEEAERAQHPSRIPTEQVANRLGVANELVVQPASYVNTILAVDDDATNIQVIAGVLAKEPYRIITAGNGNEALRILASEERIDLVILDVMMPGITGIEVARTIRHTHSLTELPILLVTVKNGREDMLEGFQAGANDFLTKPFHSYELRARVRTLLELKNSVNQAVEAELDFLRAQIKPHFLYNALNTIIGICPRDPKHASLLLKQLSQYLRGSFDFQNKEKLIPIDKEMELIRSYCHIEKARFKDRLNIRYDCDELAGTCIPPLSIQPLIENAIRHGVMKRLEGGTVRLSIQREGAYIRIAVEDDGVGISGEVLSTLLLSENKSRGVGLRNIHQRLMNMYGHGLQMESEYGQGTKVMMDIPYAGKESGAAYDKSRTD
ncbi:ATP-binding protein [Paenibacillus sp. J5C_2022]|uniref:ATP-binding protein n=1 Tax=Paenibacillus sp. J5C2022 TaxID=2977129 RepID=UPI0021CE22C6|nr:ATP-binding protein [Paenibacillus sp. J5C2022]MCU6710377.1 ATP-binding protein [Paenibacillus sp. J5C2022]